MRTAVRRAVFLDRDGILNEVVMRGDSVGSPRTLDELVIHSGARLIVDAARAAGFLTIVVTNQPDVGRGLMGLEALEALHDALRSAIPLDAIEVSTEGRDDAPRRKPNPGMLTDAAAAWDIDLSRSWIIGDSVKDIEAGRRAGVGTILLETPYNRRVHGTAVTNLCSHTAIARFISSLHS